MQVQPSSSDQFVRSGLRRRILKTVNPTVAAQWGNEVKSDGFSSLENIHMINTTGAAIIVSIWVLPTEVTETSDQYLVLRESVPANDTVPYALGNYPLNKGDKIYTQAAAVGTVTHMSLLDDSYGVPNGNSVYSNLYGGSF